MSNVAKLKKQAAELEAKKQFDKALAIYIKLVDSFDANASELDVALFNRVGDLLVRQGNVADAVDYYEKAVDLYEQTGFFNNAIALCNKILRHSPGRSSIYYKLGKASAKKGFNTDAKVNFLEYADRMQKSGKVDEAFRALQEFADLCPDQDEIRLMLAEQLTRANRKTEAVEQLQRLHERYDSEERTSEAAIVASKIRQIDPTAEPRTSEGTKRKTTSGDLVFLDLDDSTPSSRHRTPPPRAAAPAPAAPRRSQPAAPPPEPVPSDDIPLINTDAVVGTPRAVPLVESSLDALQADDSLGLVKSTPTSSFFAVDPPGTPTPSSSSVLEEEMPPIARAPAAPTAPTAPVAPPPAPVPPPAPTPPVAQAPTPPPPAPKPRAATVESLEIVDALASITEVKQPPRAVPPRQGHEFNVPAPTPVEPTPPSTIDFDLSSLVAPEPPKAAPPPRRPTPPRRTQPDPKRDMLGDLPLMDFEVPKPAPRPLKQSGREELPPTPDLELIVDPALGMTSGVDEGTPTDIDVVDLNEESLTADEDDSEPVPTPSVTRRSTLVAAHSVEVLRASVDLDPDDWSLRRQLAEAMLDAGHRAEGISELELAMNGAERFGDLDLASSLAEEIARLEPEEVRHHQKRVEYAFRTNDRSRLIEAYVALADSLLKAEQSDKARTVYQRVLDLAPDDMRARSAIDTISASDVERQTPPVAAAAQRSGVRQGELRRLATDPGDSFVNLGDWLRETSGKRDTRMVVAEEDPTGDEEADFADMLRKFKQGVAENVDAEDFQSHYDLAIAYKEMGLLDEAIASFQKALGSPSSRLPTYEALGQCFIEKAQFSLASSILSRALAENASEEQLIGVLYLLGRAAEAQGLVADAVAYYQRVFVVDIQFRDIAARLSELERALQKRALR